MKAFNEEEYRDTNKYILLRPAEFLLEASPFLKFGVAELRFTDYEREWYKSGSNFSLRLPALLRILAAANISLVDTRINDDGSNPNFGAASATGAVRMPDGTTRTVTMSGTFDVDAVIRQNIEKSLNSSETYWMKKGTAKYPGKGMSDKQITEYHERERPVLQRYRHQRAQSSAIASVARKALGMPTSYTEDETKKTFVVPVITPDIDQLIQGDPNVRMLVVANAIGATGLLYGGRSSGGGHHAIPQHEERPQLPEGGLPESPQTQSDAGYNQGPVSRDGNPPLPPELAGGAPPPPANPDAEIQANWEAADDVQRMKKLNELFYSRKHSQPEKRLAELLRETPENQAKAIVTMLKLPILETAQ
ncbi:MAG TPA: hypothetical protein PK916_09115 [Bacteroidota bacterium]|nr:hypothetical protein [Bacteroidota bacterium]